MSMALVLATLVTFGMFSVTYGAYRWLGNSGWEPGRISALQKPPIEKEKDLEKPSLLRRLDGTVEKSRVFRIIALELTRANIPMKPTEFLLLSLGVASATGLLGFMISHNLVGGVMSFLFGLFLPRWHMVRRQQKRLKEFHNQIPDILSLMVSALRAGYGLNSAFKMVVDEMPPPASEEFERLLLEVNLGFSIADAFQHLVERTKSKDMELIVTAIAIQHEVGGSLADILENISETIRERVRIRGEIQVMTAEQRMSGYVLTAMPFLLGLFLTLFNPEYMMGMFQPGWPILIPISALVMMGIGYLAMRAIINNSDVY
jgi:tight adherence protein B